MSWQMPSEVAPGQEVESAIDWQTARGNPNAVVYACVIGDWSPDEPIEQLEHGMQGSPGNDVQRTFRFRAPERPGTYRVRWILAQAFKPITSFYGKEHHGAADPGSEPWFAYETYHLAAVSDTHLWPPPPPPLPPRR